MIVLWPTLTAIFDLRLRNQRCNVIVRSSLCIIIERKQNGGIFRNPKRSNSNAPAGAEVSVSRNFFWKMEEGIDKLCLHVRNDEWSTVDNKQNATRFTKVSSQLLKILILFLKERRKFIPNVDG